MKKEIAFLLFADNGSVHYHYHYYKSKTDDHLHGNDTLLFYVFSTHDKALFFLNSTIFT